MARDEWNFLHGRRGNARLLLFRFRFERSDAGAQFVVVGFQPGQSLMVNHESVVVRVELRLEYLDGLDDRRDKLSVVERVEAGLRIADGDFRKERRDLLRYKADLLAFTL